MKVKTYMIAVYAVLVKNARSRSFPKPISFLLLSIWLLRKKLPTNEIIGEAKTPR
jgi:hypothetical protein